MGGYESLLKENLRSLRFGEEGRREQERRGTTWAQEEEDVDAIEEDDDDDDEGSSGLDWLLGIHPSDEWDDGIVIHLTSPQALSQHRLLEHYVEDGIRREAACGRGTGIWLWQALCFAVLLVGNVYTFGVVRPCPMYILLAVGPAWVKMMAGSLHLQVAEGLDRFVTPSTCPQSQDRPPPAVQPPLGVASRAEEARRLGDISAAAEEVSARITRLEAELARLREDNRKKGLRGPRFPPPPPPPLLMAGSLTRNKALLGMPTCTTASTGRDLGLDEVGL